MVRGRSQPFSFYPETDEFIQFGNNEYGRGREYRNCPVRQSQGIGMKRALEDG